MRKFFCFILIVVLLINVSCSTMVGRPLRNSLGFSCLVEDNEENDEEEKTVEITPDEEK